MFSEPDVLARMYEPVLGRFSSRDVLFGDPAYPISLNQFVYGTASPLTFSDPTGMVPMRGTTEDDSSRADDAEVWLDTDPGRCSTCSTAVAYPDPPPPSVLEAIENLIEVFPVIQPLSGIILDPPVTPGPTCCITVPGEFGPLVLLDPPAPDDPACCVTPPAPRANEILTSERSSRQFEKLGPGDMKILDKKESTRTNSRITFVDAIS